MDQQEEKEDEIDLMNYLNVILKRKLLIFLVFVGLGEFRKDSPNGNFP